MSAHDVFDTPSVERLLAIALEEDLGRGDVTSAAVIPADRRARGRLVARQALVVAGLPLCERVFERVDAGTAVTSNIADGARVDAGTTLATVDGPARSVLAGERTALNFLQRLSGVATLTRRFADAIAGTGAVVMDTRKTTPGWRTLEKYAVRMGGGINHRADLGEAVLIKDNHIAVAGSIRAAVASVRKSAPAGMAIEVEVDTLTEFDEALATGCDIILLDNFALADVREAVRRRAAAKVRPALEVSGGVTLDRIAELARAGVDRISVGALTHSAPATDLALDIDVR